MARFFEVSNLDRLIRQMRHCNLQPIVLPFYVHSDDLSRELKREINRSLHIIKEDIECSNPTEIKLIRDQALFWVKEHIDLEGISRNDPVAIDQAALHILMEELYAEYFKIDELLLSFDTQYQKSSVRKIYPELYDFIDDDGLLLITKDMRLTDQMILYRDHCIYYHQFFRRGYTSNVNFNFLARFVDFQQSHSECRVKVAIDHRRIIERDKLSIFIEQSGWPNPPSLVRDKIDDPNFTGLFTLFPSPQSYDAFTYEKTEVLWGHRSEPEIEKSRKTFEIEEVIKSEARKEFPVILNRYVHSERDYYKKVFDHFDGAIRYYSKEHYNDRINGDIANAKIISSRLKLFRIDGSISEEEWACLNTHFFRTNEMVYRYMSSLNPYASGNVES